MLDEAVQLAKEFSTDESPSFVNGLLGRLKELKPSLRRDAAERLRPERRGPVAPRMLGHRAGRSTAAGRLREAPRGAPQPPGGRTRTVPAARGGTFLLRCGAASALLVLRRRGARPRRARPS